MPSCLYRGPRRARPLALLQTLTPVYSAAMRSSALFSALAVTSSFGIVLGCTEESSPPSPASPPPAAAPAAAVAPTSAALEIQGPDGAVRFRVEPKDGGGFRLKDAQGQKIGKISVESDRVKLKDASGQLLVKVKKKDDGFKIYDGSDRDVFKGKLKGEAGLKLKTADDVAVAKLEGAAGRVGEAKVEARPIEGGVGVLKDGQRVAVLKGAVPAEPAVLFAVDALDDMQRIAVLVFMKEVW